jgi:predicted nucleic-acid-binding protein
VRAPHLGDRLPDDEVVDVIHSMLSARELRIQETEVVHRAVRTARSVSSAGFVDALIAELDASQGCTETVTFDRGAAALPSMRLLRRRRG